MELRNGLFFYGEIKQNGIFGNSEMKRFLVIFILLIIIYTLSGCMLFAVKPWDRDLLAEKQMQLTPDPLESSMDQHTFFSKEAASGGQGIGGGGCGCN